MYLFVKKAKAGVKHGQTCLTSTDSQSKVSK